jgi:hypothetical protein
MEERCQKPKMLSYGESSNVKLFIAQRRRKTTKPLQFLELMTNTVQICQKQKAVNSECEA